MADRHGNWAESSSFALGHYYGDFVVSDRFANEFVTTVPVLAEFKPSGVDPSGSRHLTNHASFENILASGHGPASFSFDDLDMQAVNISSGSGVSKTKVFLFRIASFDCANTRITNMKFWASSVTDFLTGNTHKVVYEKARGDNWQQDKALPVSHFGDPTKFVPESLPDSQNLYRQDGGGTIHGVVDDDVSEWVYVALAASGTLPLGQYGLTPASGFLLRVTYDVDNHFNLKD